jgi:hypothetical protein
MMQEALQLRLSLVRIHSNLFAITRDETYIH